MKCCAICGAQTNQEYLAYIDDAKRVKLKDYLPSKEYLTGKAQVLTSDKGNRHIFAEYRVPVCAKCAYMPLIRFNVAAAVFAAAVGTALLVLIAAKWWGIAVLLLGAASAAFAAIRHFKMKRDEPAADYAISELADSCKRGMSTQGVWYSAEKLQSALGGLGTFGREALPGYVPPWDDSIPFDAERRCRVCGRADLKLYYQDRIDPERDAVSLSCARCGAVVCTECRGGLDKFTQSSRDGHICPICHQYTVFEYTGKKDTGELLAQAEIRYDQTIKPHR